MHQVQNGAGFFGCDYVKFGPGYSEEIVFVQISFTQFKHFSEINYQSKKINLRFLSSLSV